MRRSVSDNENQYDTHTTINDDNRRGGRLKLYVLGALSRNGTRNRRTPETTKISTSQVNAYVHVCINNDDGELTPMISATR